MSDSNRFQTFSKLKQTLGAKARDFSQSMGNKLARKPRPIAPSTTLATAGVGARASLGVNSLSKLSDRLESLQKGDTLRRLSFWIAFVLCAWLIADLFSLAIQKYLPSPPISRLASRGSLVQGSQRGEFEVIAQRNLFSSSTPKQNSNEIDLDAPPVKTNLNIEIIGTVIFKNPARSIAAIQDKTEGKLYPVRQGDEILNGDMQILNVEPRQVIFINRKMRRKEFVEIPEDPNINISMNSVSSAPTTMKTVVHSDTQVQKTIPRDEILKAKSNLGSLLTQARAVPVTRGGQMVGFQLVELQPGSFYEKVGMKRDDIIKGVDGEKITDPAKAMQLVQDLTNKSSLDLVIERGGKDVTIHYDIR